MLELQRVTKLYGTVIGVNDISLSLPRGAYGLVGPNGSGKSTLLNLITGQLRPTLGSVHVLEETPWNNSAVLRQIGMCPEQDVLYPNVSGLEWVAFLLELHGWRRRRGREPGKCSSRWARSGHASPHGRILAWYASADETGAAQPMTPYSDTRRTLQRAGPDRPTCDCGDTACVDRQGTWVDPGQSRPARGRKRHRFVSVDLQRSSVGIRFRAGCQRLLADVPNEIWLRCDNASELACRLVQQGCVDSIRFAEDGRVLVVGTRAPRRFTASCRNWWRNSGICIHEMRSSDESLHALFSSLLDIHRGNVR